MIFVTKHTTEKWIAVGLQVMLSRVLTRLGHLKKRVQSIELDDHIDEMEKFGQRVPEDADRCT